MTEEAYHYMHEAEAGAPPALELRNVTKTFGDFVADDNVSMRVEHGEIHALVGENGAGKSTLMSVCFGLLQPNAGEILVDGQPVHIANPNVARGHGIGMVHQHFKLVPRLTVVENIFLGCELLTRRRSLDMRRMIRELGTVADRFGLEVAPTAVVESLSTGQRQRVEILKALYFDARVLILDEPTAVLTPQEGDRLFVVLRGLADADRAVVLITHKLAEVKASSDRYTVLRRGRVVASGDTADVTEHDIARLMVGRDVSLSRQGAGAAPSIAGAVVLSCDDLDVRDDRGDLSVRNLSLRLRSGEITGVAGVQGNGQTELVEALAGLRTAQAGHLSMWGRDIDGSSPGQRRDHGIAHIPEDRLKAGVSAESSVRDNLVAGFRSSALFHFGFLRTGQADRWAARLIERYDVRGAHPRTKTGNLSGGNIQKVVLARELESTPAVLLAAHPTRGVDIGATEFIHQMLRDERDRGAAVLLVSADLNDLFAVADRIVVMYCGEIIAEFAADASNIDRIGLAMAGLVEGADGYRPTRLDDAQAAAEPAPARPSPTIDAPATTHRGGAQVRDRARAALGSFSQPMLAVATAIAIGVLIVALIGESPATAFDNLLLGSFRDVPGLSGLIAQATPFLLIAASVYVSFRAGVVNIGAEGQMYIGAFVGALVAIHLGHGPGFVLIVSAFLSGAVAAAAWAFLPGVLYAYVGVDVLVSTLMFNYIAISLTAYFVDGPLRDPSGGVPQTELIPESAHLPTFLGFGGANAGIFVGLALTLGLGLILARSRWGLQLRIIGENREFARTVGVTVRRKIVQIMLVSGAAAGVAGVVESLGTEFRFTQSFSPGFGFLGLTVALLGRLRPLGLVVAAGLYGALEQGASLMQLNTGVPLSLVNVLEGVIILLVTASRLRLFDRRSPGSAVDLTGATTTSVGAT